MFSRTALIREECGAGHSVTTVDVGLKKLLEQNKEIKKLRAEVESYRNSYSELEQEFDSFASNVADLAATKSRKPISIVSPSTFHAKSIAFGILIGIWIVGFIKLLGYA